MGEKRTDMHKNKTEKKKKNIAQENCCICTETCNKTNFKFDIEGSEQEKLNHETHSNWCHLECIHKWLEQKKQCPLCKGVVSQEKVDEIKTLFLKKNGIVPNNSANNQRPIYRVQNYPIVIVEERGRHNVPAVNNENQIAQIFCINAEVFCINIVKLVAILFVIIVRLIFGIPLFVYKCCTDVDSVNVADFGFF